MWRQIVVAVVVAWAATQVAIRTNALVDGGVDKLGLEGESGRAEKVLLKKVVGPPLTEETLKLVLFRSLPGVAGLAVAVYWGASEAFANAGVAVSMFQAVPNVTYWLGLVLLGYTIPLHLSTWIAGRLLGFRWVALPLMVSIHALNNAQASLRGYRPLVPEGWQGPAELGLTLAGQVLPAVLVLAVALRWAGRSRRIGRAG